MVQVVVINRVVLTASISCQNKSWINSSWESCISQTIKKIYLSSPWCILLLQREKKNSEKRGFSSFGGIKLARLNFFFIGGESVHNQLFYAKKENFQGFCNSERGFWVNFGIKKKIKSFLLAFVIVMDLSEGVSLIWKKMLGSIIMRIPLCFFSAAIARFELWDRWPSVVPESPRQWYPGL